MGVYIDMEMPKNCISCAARHGAECWLADCSYIPNLRKERPKWCPLVPVPPHGDLIDRDALPTSRVEGEDVVNAPAIIPAEEDKP